MARCVLFAETCHTMMGGVSVFSTLNFQSNCKYLSVAKGWSLRAVKVPVTCKYVGVSTRFSPGSNLVEPE